MSKSIRVVLAIVLMVFFTCSPLTAYSAWASDNTQCKMTAQEKLLFAEKMDSHYAKLVEQGTAEIFSAEENASLLFDLYDSNIDQKQTIKRMSKRGLYAYFFGENSITEHSVSIYAPTVVYDAVNKEWTVICAGRWLNFHPNQFPAGSIGGMDAFGVSFTNTSGRYDSHIVRMCSMLTTKDGRCISAAYNRADGNGDNGFGFRMQDCYTEPSLNTDKYLGYRWFGMCVYDESFADYSGTATAYYIHTWDNTHITDIVLGVDQYPDTVLASFANSGSSLIVISESVSFGRGNSVAQTRDAGLVFLSPQKPALE